MTSPKVPAIARAWSWCSYGSFLNATQVGKARLLGLSRLNPGTQLWIMLVPHLDLKGGNISALCNAFLSSLDRKRTLLPHSYTMTMCSLEAPYSDLVATFWDFKWRALDRWNWRSRVYPFCHPKFPTFDFVLARVRNVGMTRSNSRLSSPMYNSNISLTCT